MYKIPKQIFKLIYNAELSNILEIVKFTQYSKSRSFVEVKNYGGFCKLFHHILKKRIFSFYGLIVIPNFLNTSNNASNKGKSKGYSKIGPKLFSLLF